MRLLTIGDSFTYGDELADLTSAWPNLLANKLDYTLTNLAKPGSGNNRMVRHCVEQINNYDMIIVAWSHFARIEMADEGGFYDIWPGCSPNPYLQQLPWRKDIIEYYTRYHNDEYLYRQYLINIVLVQNYLRSNNKKCLMLDSFGNHQTSLRYSYENKDLLDQIDKKNFIGWPTETMMEWAYGCPKGPNGHFLERGHEIVADKIYEYIRHLGWIS